jgi:hypothetical protein
MIMWERERQETSIGYLASHRVDREGLSYYLRGRIDE